jgi:hypothetical protein
MSLKTKDHRAVTCNNCMKKFEVQEEEPGHTADCIENKFLLAVDAQLDTLLAHRKWNVRPRLYPG